MTSTSSIFLATAICTGSWEMEFFCLYCCPNIVMTRKKKGKIGKHSLPFCDCCGLGHRETAQRQGPQVMRALEVPWKCAETERRDERVQSSLSMTRPGAQSFRSKGRRFPDPSQPLCHCIEGSTQDHSRVRDGSALCGQQPGCCRGPGPSTW